MTNEEKIREAIRTSCFKHGEGFLEPQFYSDEIYSSLHDEATALCKRYASDATFFFVDGIARQAAAVHAPKAVLVYKGMVEHILRLASMLCSVVQTPTPATEARIMPWSGRLEQWLSKNDFDSQCPEYWWLSSEEHRTVFDYIVLNLFRFVVLHEIGHIHHKHGWRRTQHAPNTLQINDLASETHWIAPPAGGQSGDEIIAIHAREIVADTFAFGVLTQLYPYDPDTPSHDSRSILENTAFGFASSLTTVAPYFWSMSVVNKMNEHAQTNKYPTHTFRTQAVESEALRLADELNFPQGIEILKGAMLTNFYHIAKITGDQSHAQSRLLLNDENHLKHYELVITEKPNWEN